MAALVDATTALIVEQGMTMSVREIARRAGVNHGLVHTYFGSKEALLEATFRAINDRAGDELDADGFPPADLAFRRDGELAKATARALLDLADDPFPSHPVLPAWRRALATTNPDSTDHELNERILIATTLALGWSLFGEHFGRILEVDPEARRSIEQRVVETIAEIGGLPDARRVRQQPDES